MRSSRSAHRRTRSPPLSRGILHTGRRPQELNPITPALAGNTDSEISAAGFRNGHPRVRGEYAAGVLRQSLLSRSPPRSRGIYGEVDCDTVLATVTPAFAGNTKLPPVEFRRYDGHPRARGEYIAHKCAGPSHTRSPPLSRGIHQPAQGRQQLRPITPALAGNTGPLGCVLRSDHPRF